MQRPLLLEGEAGVGKTEVAKVLSAAFDSPLIRLQCYEGLDVSQAAYEWNYARQLLEIRLMEASGAVDRQSAARELFDERFLLKRPLLQALAGEGARRPVLLIDELDRADEEFEGFLLEFLADFQITIPELGTIRADAPPDRGHHLEPDARASRRPEAALPVLLDRPARLRQGAADRHREGAATRRGGSPSRPPPSSSSCARPSSTSRPAFRRRSTGWRRSSRSIKTELDPAVVDETLGILVKNQEDLQTVRGEKGERLAELVDKVRTEELRN